MKRRMLLGLMACAPLARGQASIEVNRATVIDLDGLRGIGPALSARLLAERERGPFSDWPDLIRRVPGLGAASAARLSAQGLTVNGAAFPPPP